MPFTLAAFTKTYAAAGTLDLLNGIADPHIRISNQDVWIPEVLPLLAGYYINGAVLTLARIESPTLRTLTPIDVCPYDVGAEPLSPAAFNYQGHAPKAVGGGEALNFRVSVSAASQPFGLVWLSDGPLAPVTGEIFTVLATAAVTLVANAWTNGAITFAQTLPKGRYQVVGMRAESVGLIAARLVFPGYAWRPGCIGSDAVGDLVDPAFRAGRMGVWGEFDHDLPPTVDFLSISADTSERVFLDLIKIA